MSCLGKTGSRSIKYPQSENLNRAGSGHKPKRRSTRLKRWVHAQELTPSGRRNMQRKRPQRRMLVSISVEAGVRMTNLGLVGPDPGPSRWSCRWKQGILPLVAIESYALTWLVGAPSTQWTRGVDLPGQHNGHQSASPIRIFLVRMCQSLRLGLRLGFMKHRPLTFVWLSPNVADGNRIARGVSTSLLLKGSDDVGKNRKAGETPARARHCNWESFQQA